MEQSVPDYMMVAARESMLGLQEKVAEWFSSKGVFINNVGGYCVMVATKDPNDFMFIVSLPNAVRSHQIENVLLEYDSVPVVFQYDTPENVKKIINSVLDPDFEAAARTVETRSRQN